MVVFFSRKGINVLLLPVVAIGVVVGVKSVRREGGRVGLVVVVGEVLTTRVVVLFGSMNGMRVRVAVVEGSRDAVGVVTEEVLVRDAVVFPGSLKGSSDVLTVLDIDAVVVVIRGVVAVVPLVEIGRLVEVIVGGGVDVRIYGFVNITVVVEDCVVVDVGGVEVKRIGVDIVGMGVEDESLGVVDVGGDVVNDGEVVIVVETLEGSGVVGGIPQRQIPQAANDVDDWAGVVDFWPSTCGLVDVPGVVEPRCVVVEPRVVLVEDWPSMCGLVDIPDVVEPAVVVVVLEVVGPRLVVFLGRR